jgi:hypothetical protein
MKRKSAPSKKRPRSARPDPSTRLRTGPSTGLGTGPLRQRSAQALRQSSGQASAELGTETEMPLDAEDVALASLEAQVRAEEAQAELGPVEPVEGLTVRLPRRVILRLRAQAAERNVTPSKLVELALAKHLTPERARRRRR